MNRFHRLLAAAALVFLAGCWGAQTRKDLPPEVLYQQALEQVEDGAYEPAQKTLDFLRDQYPFSKFAVEAELLEADMLFDQEKYEEAAAAYRAFEELHPTHSKLGYAVFRRGLSYEELSLPPDRDQTGTHNAIEAYQKLLYLRPEGEHAAEARERMEKLRQRLAEHELYVARYYKRRKMYDAARGRVAYLVRNFPDTPARQEAEQLARELDMAAESRDGN